MQVRITRRACTNAVETYAYNDRLQPVMMELGTPGNASANYCLVYNYYWGTGNPSSCSVPGQSGMDNGSLLGYFYQDSVNPSLSHTAAFHNDGMNRLYEAQATGNSTYFFDFSRDRYGNMTCTINGNTNGPCPEYSFDPNTNRITNSGFSYDAAGDLTNDGAHSYQYDAEGRMISEDGHQSTYNALGQRVEYDTAAYPVELLYDADGSEIGRYSSSGYDNGGVPYWWGADVRFGGHILAYDICCGYREIFLHRNSLGSVTMPTDYAGNPLDDLLLYPWGSYWTDKGQIQTQQYAGFEGMEPSEGFYPAGPRMYQPSYGRWLSPDPLGGNIADPQSLNRYAYALNDPPVLTDPSGLTTIACGPLVLCTTVTGATPDPGEIDTITLPSEEGVTAPHTIPPGVKPRPNIIMWPQLRVLVHQNNVARAYNVCDELVDCIVFRESHAGLSGGNPKLKVPSGSNGLDPGFKVRGVGARNGKGGRGLMGLESCRNGGPCVSAYDPFNPAQNIRVGSRFLQGKIRSRGLDAGVASFGTGPDYASHILNCLKLLQAGNAGGAYVAATAR